MQSGLHLHTAITSLITKYALILLYVSEIIISCQSTKASENTNGSQTKIIVNHEQYTDISLEQRLYLGTVCIQLHVHSCTYCCGAYQKWLDLVSVIFDHMPLWQPCAEIQVKSVFALQFSVYQWIKHISVFFQLWRYLLFCNKYYQTLPYKQDTEHFCSTSHWWEWALKIWMTDT